MCQAANLVPVTTPIYLLFTRAPLPECHCLEPVARVAKPTRLHESQRQIRFATRSSCIFPCLIFTPAAESTRELTPSHLRQAGPRTSAPPAVTQSLVASNRATSQAGDYEGMKGEVQLWSLALCAMCSGATTYFYSQVSPGHAPACHGHDMVHACPTPTHALLYM